MTGATAADGIGLGRQGRQV